MVATLALLGLPCPRRVPLGVRATVHQALNQFWTAFHRGKGRSLSRHAFRVLWRLRACRTPRLGGFRYHCDHCDYDTVLYQSCHDRHCPRCQGRRRRQWADRQAELMLPVPHFQVVFTVPDDLWPIMQRFPRQTYDLLLKASGRPLLDLGQHRWKATPSVLAVLHTWNREMSFYPHVHCVVSAGGLRDNDTWKAQKPNFLFHVKAMSVRFRGKFLAGLAALDLDLTIPELAALKRARSRAAQKHWYAFVEAPDRRDSRPLLRYLARYVNSIAISDHRIVDIDANTVTFRTRDGHLTLPGDEFVHRFSLHILPKGFRKQRAYGLLAPSRRTRLETARRVLDGSPPQPQTNSAEQDEDLDLALLDALDVEFVHAPRPIRRCPTCEEPLRAISLPPLRATCRGPP